MGYPNPPDDGWEGLPASWLHLYQVDHPDGSFEIMSQAWDQDLEVWSDPKVAAWAPAKEA